MLRAFFDSSVLFSAAYSKTGHAHDLVRISAQGDLIIVVSNFVVGEARHNLSDLKVQKLTDLDQILSKASIEIVHVAKEEIIDAAHLIVLKDAPILAAAKAAKVDMLVSLDKKHILGRPALEEYINAPIITPAEAFQRLMASD
jgi:predicted nucleic acid-binding protein